jgi:hypothetical protein
MNSGHRIRTVASGICAAALLCASYVDAQTVYKQVDDEGHSVFSDRPPAKSALAPTTRRGARQIEANEAARRLKQAQLERKRGTDPQAGELTPGTGKGTVNYRYWRRQEKLRQVVEQAQRRANETQRPQLASQ